MRIFRIKLHGESIVYFARQSEQHSMTTIVFNYVRIHDENECGGDISELIRASNCWYKDRSPINCVVFGKNDCCLVGCSTVVVAIVSVEWNSPTIGSCIAEAIELQSWFSTHMHTRRSPRIETQFRPIIIFWFKLLLSSDLELQLKTNELAEGMEQLERRVPARQTLLLAAGKVVEFVV